MRKDILRALAFGLAITLTACEEKGTETPIVTDPGKGEFIDCGSIPASLDAGRSIAEFQSAIYNDGYVFVATSDGVWKNELATKTWSRAGLEGKSISAIYKHPDLANKFFAGVHSDNTASFKTLYISNDGGSNWEAGENLIYNGLENFYEDYVCFAVRPGHPDHIYANLNGGTMIAISTDGGLNWVRMNNETESYFGYQCTIAFTPGDASTIYQGSENPLDVAWLGAYEIDESHPELLTNFSRVVNTDTWGNRRPNELLSFSYTGEALYVGQEGALSIFSGDSSRYIYKSEDGNLPYTYVDAIWVDPENTKRILFGGIQNGGNDMNLYETCDEGDSIFRFTDKMGFSNPDIREFISTDSYPAILINDDGENEVRLYLYKVD